MPGRLRVGRSTDLGDRTFFFEIIPDLLVITGFDGYVRDANTAWQHAVGWTRQELLAVPFIEFVHPEDRTRMATELEMVRKGIFMMFLESRFQCKDGTYRWLMWKAAGMPGRSKIYLLGREIVQGRDGTLRPGRAEGALERRASHLDMAEDWLEAGSWEVDVASRRFWWSGGLARLLGHDAADAPADADAALAMVVDEDRDGVRAALRRALDAGQADLWFRARRRDGTVLWLHGMAKAVRGRDGAATALAGIVRAALSEAPGRLQRSGSPAA